MRLAGTISRYSNSAMPQLASAAIHQGLDESSFRCAYQAKVMNTFEAMSRPAEVAMGESCMSGNPFDLLGSAGGQECAGLSFPRYGNFGIKLEQGLEHERALVHARVGHRQAGPCDPFIAEKQQVEIERPGRIGK